MKPIIKVPVRLAPHLGVSKSLVVRWNLGKRGLSNEMAMRIVDILQAEGTNINILVFKPELRKLIPCLCQSHAEQRKLCQESPEEADCPVK